MKGMIVKNAGSWYEILDNEGNLSLCQVKGKFRLKGVKTTNPVAVGDQVEFEMGPEGSGWITHIYERKNCIIRKSVNLSKQTHLLACNLDLAVIMVSLCQPCTPQGFIDRFLLTCEAYHVPCCLVFNKIDLYDDSTLNNLRECMEMYSKIGYPCYAISVKENIGIDAVKSVLKDKICLLAGNSGVGKSALVKCIAPQLDIRIGEISATHEKGKHTTTFAQMYPLSFGGYIVDSPGIKEFGMVKMNTEEISRYFPEMRDRIPECQFNNCTHDHEPHCAVKDAVKKGEIHPLRYQSYLHILHGDEIQIPGLIVNKKEGSK